MWAYILVGALFLLYLLYYHFSTKGAKLTGRATVVSHRLELGAAAAGTATTGIGW